MLGEDLNQESCLTPKIPKAWIIFFGLFLLGAGLRSLDEGRPVDYRIRPVWRECDYASIARNYWREGMNILSPRIDWRGDGPGYAEMEFPLFPWVVAVMYKVFGYNELWGKLFSYLISLTLFIFFRLASYLLESLSAIIASLFFVLSPLAIRISNFI